VIKKEAEKILKHKDLTTEIQRTWDIEINVIPVITGVKLEPSQNHSKNTRATYGESMKSRNYTKKHPFWEVKGKGKAIPLQAWTGPEGSRRLRLLDFKTIGT